jgi:hypothetical protein
MITALSLLMTSANPLGTGRSPASFRTAVYGACGLAIS